MGDYTKTLVRGTGIVFIMMIATAVLGYLFRSLLARNLSVEDFGLFFAVFSFLSLFYGFKGFGLGTAVVRFITEYRLKEDLCGIKKVLNNFLLIQLVIFGFVSIMILLFSRNLANHYFKNPEAFPIIISLTIAFLFTLIFTTFNAILHSYKKMHYLSSIEFFQSLFLLIMSFLLLKLNLGIMAPAYAYIISFIIVAIWGFIISLNLFPYFKVKTSFYEKKEMGKLIHFGIPVFVGMISSSILLYFGTLALTYLSTLKDVAFYNVALPTANVLRFIPRALTIALLPIITELDIVSKDKLSKGITLIYTYLMVIIVPLAMIMFAFSSEIIILLFGEKYLPASLSLKILTIGMIFTSIYLVNQYVILSMNKPKEFTKVVVVGAVLNVVLNLTLIPFLATVGAALAFTLSSLLMLIYSSFKIKPLLDLHIPWLVWLKVLFCGGFLLASIFILRDLFYFSIWVKATLLIGIGFIVYILGIFILKIIHWEELLKIKKLVWR